MNFPDLPLPFDLALPDINGAVALTVLLSALLGGLAVDVLLTMRPFSRHRTSRLAAVLSLAALIAGCLVFGAFADHSQNSLVAAAVVAAPGALAYWAVYRSGGGDRQDEAGVLPDSELRRGKTRSDRWVLVTGASHSGKTALVDTMIAVPSLPLAGAVRRAEDGELRATELGVRDRRGSVWTLRVWEAPSIDGHRGRLPSLDDFDAVVLTVDPVQHAPIADSFPDVLREGRTPADANGSVLHLAGALPGGPRVWAVATKADLLRFSVHPELLDLPLRTGPGWYEQVRSMSVEERRRLADALGLDQLTREHEPAFTWGTGSPLFAYRGGSGDQKPFGAPELMNSMLEALWARTS